MTIHITRKLAKKFTNVNLTSFFYKSASRSSVRCTFRVETSTCNAYSRFFRNTSYVYPMRYVSRVSAAMCASAAFLYHLQFRSFGASFGRLHPRVFRHSIVPFSSSLPSSPLPSLFHACYVRNLAENFSTQM